MQNNSGQKKLYAGKTIEIGEIYSIPENQVFKFRQSDDLVADIADNLIAVGNTAQFFTTKAQRLSHFYGADIARYTPTGNLQVSQYEPEGTFSNVAGFNFADKTTWYIDAVRVTGESPSLKSGETLVYELANDFAIDAMHGKITGERDYQVDVTQLLQGNYVKSQSIRESHGLVVYVNGSAVVEDTDFTVDYRDSEITFINAPVGPVTVDYSYATTSNIYLTPQPGKILRARRAEVNLTANICMKPIVREFQIFNPAIGQYVTLDYVVYDNPYNIIDINNEGKGYIRKLDGMDDDMIIFPFDYIRSIDIKHSEGTRLKVSIENDQEFTTKDSLPGRATATFYSAEEEEL